MEQPTKGSVQEVVGVNLKSSLEFVHSRLDNLINWFMSALGSVSFLIITLTTIAGWLFLNSTASGITPFDPYPYTWLSALVSVSGMIIAIIVLIGQNRQAKLAEIRQQIDFEINIRTEHEVTKILNMLDAANRARGIAHDDEELEEMKITTDIAEIKENVEEILRNKEQ